MRMADALSALSLVGLNSISQADIKKAYHARCREFHPDVNPGGDHLMKLVNAAYERLLECRFPITFKEGQEVKSDFGEKLSDALSKIIHFPDLVIEICGSWVWISGDTKKYKDHLKEAGFRYAANKKSWYCSPEGGPKKRGQNWSMGRIRETFGSKRVKTEEKTKVAA